MCNLSHKVSLFLLFFEFHLIYVLCTYYSSRSEVWQLVPCFLGFQVLSVLMTCQTCPCFLVHVQYSNLCFLVLVSCHWIWAHVSQFSFPSLCYTVFVSLSLFLGLCFSILVRRSGFFLQSLFPGPCFMVFFFFSVHISVIFSQFFSFHSILVWPSTVRIQ